MEIKTRTEKSLFNDWQQLAKKVDSEEEARRAKLLEAARQPPMSLFTGEQWMNRIASLVRAGFHPSASEKVRRLAMDHATDALFQAHAAGFKINITADEVDLPSNPPDLVEVEVTFNLETFLRLLKLKPE